MRYWIPLIIVVFAVRAAVADTTVFVNVNVISMITDTVASQRTVIVTDGRIATIGNVDVVPVPEEATVVDGTDRFLVPGLAEMHAHVPDAASADLDRYFALFVANGVTTLRGMLGRPSHLQLRDDLLSGKVFGPRLITSGPSLNGRSVSGAAHGERQVREQHAAGYDFLKIHPGLDAQEFAAIANTANELGMPFAGHVPSSVGVPNALAAGIATIDHLDGYMAALLPSNHDRSGGYGGFFDVLLANQVNTDEIEALAAATASAGTWNVPTQVLIEQLINEIPVSELRNRPEMQYMPVATVRRWVDAKESQLAERGFSSAVAAQAIEVRRALILALHQAGGGILLGSDAPQIFNVPGFSLHDELQLLVASGLTPFEALQAGTINVARFLGLDTGAVEVGRQADLVLLDANPLEDIGNSRRIHGVMLRGTWYSSGDIERRLRPYRRAGNP
ncbi:MAG: amidohydrolase family protein [Woeseiaceae bacterium]